ncbi:diversity-generating retroelement protein Avd [Thermoflexibacter ruber]|uniref:23S rRNA-intervening sequence protein n=1 Tax=Thermoflexibacter ruber TaxID=1003 RepID=A0A1I2GZJ4_9BACT|nr:diversity-generating retroelement protein Avd [Thermoflexibacter ruber]SFF22832.1 23S rRNA-intervening sequence protein [Thermoflexibacter ruber]
MTDNFQYPIFEHWYKTTDWILDKCDKMPKQTRFTVSSRIAALTIENLELLTEAIYSKAKIPLLQKVNMNLEKLRIFFRLSKDRQYMSLAQYEYGIQELNQTGRMCGGWLKECKE